MEQVGLELEEEGVKSFSDSFDQLLATIETRSKAAVAQV